MPSSTVKTRTKDKYRVVYTDHQRLELEKEFHYSRYITIRRKAELAATLGLSERQVGTLQGPVIPSGGGPRNCGHQAALSPAALSPSPRVCRAGRLLPG